MTTTMVDRAIKTEISSHQTLTAKTDFLYCLGPGDDRQRPIADFF